MFFWGSLDERGLRIHDEGLRSGRRNGGVITPNKATILSIRVLLPCLVKPSAVQSFGKLSSP